MYQLKSFLLNRWSAKYEFLQIPIKACEIAQRLTVVDLRPTQYVRRSSL